MRRGVAMAAVIIVMTTAVVGCSNDSASPYREFASDVCGELTSWQRDLRHYTVDTERQLDRVAVSVGRRDVQATLLDQIARRTRRLASRVAEAATAANEPVAKSLGEKLARDFDGIAARVADIGSRWRALPVDNRSTYDAAKRPLREEYLTVARLPDPLQVLTMIESSTAAARALADAFESDPACRPIVGG